MKTDFENTELLFIMVCYRRQ